MLRGETAKKQWVNWVKLFGQEIDEKAKLNEEQKQLYLKGLIDHIEARFLPDAREHELTIYFNHPIVGDGIAWKDQKKDLGIQSFGRVENNQNQGGKAGRKGKVNYPLAKLLYSHTLR